MNIGNMQAWLGNCCKGFVLISPPGGWAVNATGRLRRFRCWMGERGFIRKDRSLIARLETEGATLAAAQTSAFFPSPHSNGAGDCPPG